MFPYSIRTFGSGLSTGIIIYLCIIEYFYITNKIILFVCTKKISEFNHEKWHHRRMILNQGFNRKYKYLKI
jgi:hypothetical protein